MDSAPPGARAIHDTADVRFSRRVLKVAIVAALDMAIAAQIQAVRRIGAPTRMVALRFVPGLSAALTASALGCRPRKVRPLTCVRTVVTLMACATASPAIAFLRFTV